jgi:flagellar motor switch protein FliG
MIRKPEELIPVDGKKEASELLASLDPTQRERILSEIAIQNPDLAEQLRKGIFRFEQVLSLDPIELQKVIRPLDQRILALSLRGMTPEERSLLYSKIPERMARALDEENQSMGPQRMSDVKTAREKITEIAVVLHQKGEITLKR